ncbi:MAG: hypothetical protein IPK20_18675 [Betaproteobacteria bacterium]|nr:hypothetical protein [Betaproteobacteria bacterium]
MERVRYRESSAAHPRPARVEISEQTPRFVQTPVHDLYGAVDRWTPMNPA